MKKERGLPKSVSLIFGILCLLVFIILVLIPNDYPIILSDFLIRAFVSCLNLFAGILNISIWVTMIMKNE